MAWKPVSRLGRMKMLEAALKWHNAGCSVIPIRADGTKKPLVSWAEFQQAPATVEQLETWWGPNPRLGIGVVCGTVSGDLEMLELEGRATDGVSLTKIHEQCAARGVDWLFATLTQDGYAEWTPSGGIHMLYRISDRGVPGNTKVARRPATPEELEANPSDKIKVLSETRGEGGYVIVAPTAGTVHPSGESWSLLAGELGVIPTVSWAERCLLLEAITAALDEMPAPVAPPQRQLPKIQRNGLLPGEDFNDRATWQEILEPHGWSVTEYRGNETFWIRPGKKFDGRGSHSATTGFKGDGADDRLYVFSSSTEFEPERPYNKFAAYTLLEHHGNYAAAAKELSRRGYGTSAVQPAAVAYDSTSLPVPSGLVPVREVPQQAPVVAVQQEAMIRVAPDLPDIPERLLNNRDWDDHGAAEMYAEAFGGTLRYVGDEHRWRAWDGARWKKATSEPQWAMHGLVRAAKLHIPTLERSDHPGTAAFKKFVNKMAGMGRIAGIPRMAQDHPQLSVLAEHFDAQTHLVTVGNGVLDLNTGKLQPHDPGLMLTKKMNANFKPEAGTGRWGTFMEQVLPDAGVRGFLQRAFGYALLGTADQRAMFMLHGDSGSGKSQVLEGVAKIFGDFSSSISQKTFQPMTDNGLSDALHKLIGARLGMQSELNKNAVLNEGLIKSITGGDTISTRPLYGEYRDWKPQAVIFVATNFLPQISSSDNAIWKRIKPIKFDQCFVDEDGNPLDPAAAGLGVRIATEEPECVLNWLLEGIEKFRAEGLAQPEKVRGWSQAYRHDTDTVRQFLSEGQTEGRIKVEVGLEAQFRELHRAYVTWCEDNHLKPIRSREFNDAMEAAGFQRREREKGVMWQGVGLIGWIAANQQSAVGRGYHPRL